jgi:hypothetical protein
MRAAALARGSMPEKVRQQVSANSTVANLYSISLLDGSQEQKIRTILNVAQLLKCNEKTIRRALKSKVLLRKLDEYGN